MEYLMTYGWAILIIAVVLGALFGLGFFNSANLAPKVAAGACQVYRPYGPGTTAYINIEGTCNNELPQYVAQYTGSGNILVTGIVGSKASGDTVSFWMFPRSAQASGAAAVGFSSGNYIGFTGSPLTFGVAGTGTTASTLSNAWSFVAVTYNGIYSTVYIDGVATSTHSGLSGGSTLNIGNSGSAGFNGLLSNVQLYNASLSSNEITSLYDEGIGGTPVSLGTVIGWWQLNGNPNDYSGNLQNGVASGVTFTSSWTSGYTAP